MLTKLSKILIGVLALVVIGVAIAYYVNAFVLQQKEINLLQRSRPAIVTLKAPSVTSVPTATPSASSVSLVKPTVVTPGITSTVVPTYGGVK